MKHDSIRGKLVHQNSFQASKYPKYSLACLHDAISGSDLYLTLLGRSRLTNTNTVQFVGPISLPPPSTPLERVEIKKIGENLFHNKPGES